VPVARTVCPAADGGTPQGVRRIATLWAVALAGALLVSPAFAAPAAAEDNTAVAVNTKDGSSVFKFAFSIKKVADDVVDPTNAAVAYASCTDCETVAVAIQVVLVSGDPEVVAPENVAIAFNENCTLCETLAMAYQFVFSTGDEPVHFTNEGKERLKEIKKAFKELQKADLPIEEVEARVRVLAQQINDVVSNEMVAGPPGQAKQDEGTSTTSTTTATAGDAGMTTTTTPPATTTTTESPSTTTSAPASTTTP
jgi:putative peptide zinc metalloprotease protein